MNFNNNPIIYPKDDGLKPTKDNGLNPPCYPKEDGLNPFKAIVERINALESVTRNYGDSFETKKLNVTENAQIENLNATEGTVNRLNSANATVTNLNSTNATVNTLNSTNGNIKNAEVEKLDVTENAQIKNLHATEGTVDTLNSTNCNIKNAQIENLRTNKLTWDLPSIDVENAEVEKLHATTEIKVENLKTEEPILSNAVVGYDVNGKMIPIKIAELEEKVDKDLANATGTLPVANGGTGQTTVYAAANAFINSLDIGTSDPEDADYYVCQSAGGGTTNTAYYRRPVSKLWEYIKGKISSILGLTKDTYGGKASTAGTADKTVNDITIGIPYVAEGGQYVIPLGNILEPTSTATESPYNWDITGFLSIIRPVGHNGSHLWFEAGHGYSHAWTTYAYLDKEDFSHFSSSIKVFQYNGKWWMGLCLQAQQQGYSSKMTITYSRGLPATPTCILYNSQSDGVANEEIYNSIQDIPSSWWKERVIYNPTTFIQNITAPNITSLEQRVTALESDFDYTVDSQQKFNDLLSILKSGTPNTYRSIAIIGGLGNGEHGEYLYTLDSNSSDANLNNASLIGLNNPKIVITINNANTFKVFKNGVIKDIDFNIGGTVNAGKIVTLLHNCTYNNGKIALNNTSANFNIVNTTLSNVVNDECKSFVGCTLNDCETIQSAFTNCSSEMLYVSTDTNIANKYSFNKCGIHLDMKKTNMTQLETVTINISSMTDSKLTVLDTSSKLKKIILNVESSDSLSEIIGNNDKKYSIYEPYVKRVYKSVSPSMRSKAYLCVMDESHTPIFSNDGITFYLDEAMTQQVKCFSTLDSNYKTTYYFTLASDTSILYSSLTLNKQVIDTNEKYSQSIISLKLSDICDEFILNGNSLKTYICMNDTSGTLLYSNDSGTTLYVSPYISSDTKLTYIKDMNSDSKLFKLRETQAKYAENLNVFNKQHNFEGYNFVTPRLLEVTVLKDNYAVQVVSNYDVPIYVENAFSTKVKNG